MEGHPEGAAVGVDAGCCWREVEKKMKAQSIKFSTETELAKTVIAWLRNMDWEIYQEVQCGSGGPIADIVALRDGITWAIECKLSMSLALLEQAHEWCGRANYTSIACPYKHLKGHSFAREVMKHFGIGHLSIQGAQYTSMENRSVDERMKARFFRKTPESIKKWLNESQKTFSEAGNSCGSRWTPFAQTCANILEFVKQNEGCSLSDVMKRLKHHYASPASARGAIRKWGLAGSIKGVYFKQEGKIITLQTQPVKSEALLI